MATNDLIPLFLADPVEQPEQPDTGKAWDIAVISSLILKTSILLITAASIVFAILSVGNPLVFFANVTASPVAISAPQDRTGQSMPIIQSAAGAQALPPTASEAPTRVEIAAAFKTDDQSPTEIGQPPAEDLLNKFQAWAADKNARAQVRPVQPVQDAQAQPAQDVRAQVVQNARAQVRPEQKQRQARPVQKQRHARSAQKRRQPRSVQNAGDQDTAVQNAQAPRE